MSKGIKPGTRFGRWTVVGPLPSRRRSGTLRRRSKVRCVCSHEQSAWDAELTNGRTHGCSSRECMHRWDTLQLLRPSLLILGHTEEEVDEVCAIWLRALAKLRAGSLEEPPSLPLGELHQLVLFGVD
ncbi:MAG: hypothetical protein AAGH15_09515 [Myxococcota bacterium]